MKKNELTWQAYDKTHQTHSPDWYFAVGIISLSIVVTAVILGNTLFAVLVIISTLVLFLRTLQEPRLMNYELTNRGLWINKEFHAFSTFASFWVEAEEVMPKLILKSKNFLTPLLIIPFEQIYPDEVREFLVPFLLEVEHHEPLSKRIMEFLGF